METEQRSDAERLAVIADALEEIRDRLRELIDALDAQEDQVAS